MARATHVGRLHQCVYAGQRAAKAADAVGHHVKAERVEALGRTVGR